MRPTYLAASLVALVGVASIVSAQPITTEPLIRIGLGDLGYVALSPDGSTAVTSGGGGTYIWDTDAGEIVRHLDYPDFRPFGMALSADGSLIATGMQDRRVLVWDTATGDLLLNLSGHAGIPRRIAFASDGSFLATGADDTTVRIWNLPAGTLRATLTGHTTSIRGVHIGGSDELLASREESGNSVRVYNTANGALVHNLTDHTGNIGDAVISPDGTRIATANTSGDILLYNATTGDMIGGLLDTPSSNYSPRLAFSPDSSLLLSGSSTAQLRAYDADDGTVVRSYPDGRAPFAISPDGTTVTARAPFSTPNTANVLSIADASVIGALDLDDTAGVIEYSADGSRQIVTGIGNAAGRRNSFAHVFDSTTHGLTASLEGHMDWSYHARISPDESRMISIVVNSSTIACWSLSDPDLQFFIDGVGGNESARADFSPDSAHFAASMQDGLATIFDAEDGGEVLSVGPYPGFTDGVRYSNGGGILAVAHAIFTPSPGEGIIRLFDSGTGDLLDTIEEVGTRVRLMEWSPDDSMLAAGTDSNEILLLDPTTGDTLHTFSPSSSQPRVMHFSADGERLYTLFSGESRVRVYNAQTGGSVYSLIHGATVVDFVLSPKESMVVTAASDNYLRTWNAATGSQLGAIQTPYFQFNGLSVSNYGNWIAVGGSILGPVPPEVSIYNPDTGQRTERIRGHYNSNSRLYHINGGRHLVTLGQDGLIRVWEPLLPTLDAGNLWHQYR